jgi:membrane-associated phospholipid phosphatase
MRTFSALLRHARFFLIPFGIFLLVAGIIFMLYSKEQIHISINQHYSSFGDFMMPKITLAADGITIIVLILLMFAWNRRIAFFTGIACLLASFITQTLKMTLFNGDPRPKLFFANPSPLRFVPGIENYLYDTFPSGHTTVAFAFLFSLVFIVKNNFLKLGFFLLGLLVGYSRIYLSQHFLEDVYGGSIVGTTSAFLVFLLAVKMNWVKLPNLQLANEN